MKFILGKKLNMTQIFADDGKVIPATVISAGPMTIVQVKTEEKDGYRAAQFGFGPRKAKNIPKAQIGHMKDLGTFAHLKECRLDVGDAEPKVGDKVDAGVFAPGDTVVVSSISKGKGFQGVVKRHGFAGGPRTHGQKHSEREPGSIGGGLRNKVPKGMRMAGRMGGERVSVKNLKIVQIKQAENILIVSGAVPGRRGTLVEIRG